ncbi:SusD/RagB family nutrient-binding outer membrane lipoprotein [Lutibacter sp.]|uniref:SusD/RagB family nutrient-binding outer membrane lipoprotein n=1 Tax=Lutibacter sp. TaxID=1925666 RepID=UPI003564782F
MKNFKYILMVLFILDIATSCSNYEELNTNPDTASTVSPEMLAAGVLKGTYRFWNPNPNDFTTANLGDHYVVDQDIQGAQYYNPYAYGSFGSFLYLTDLKRMVEYSEGSINESSYKGLALFMKAYYGYYATINMGDIPYSEAGLAEEGNVTPIYDKQSDVFVQVLEDLRAAEEYFAAGTTFSGDMMYTGNATKWRKLCNGMQLKVIQTMSKKATAAQKARFAEIVAANNLLVDNTDNFKLTYTDYSGTNHPFYSATETKRLKVILSKLVVDILKNNNDRRLFYFAEPASALIASGKLESDFEAYEGALSSLENGIITSNNLAGNYSTINKRYGAIQAGDPMIRFTYGEQCFIIAEAIEEGWVSGGTSLAKTYYQNGVKAMLGVFMSLPAASAANYAHGMPINQTYIDNYFTGNAAYAETGTKEDRLHQIWNQRYLIDFFQGNSGYYHQFLRVGYPVLPLDPATSQNPDDNTLYPHRLKYPTSEITTNPENYQLAIDSQYGGYDGINKIPWYLQD